MESLPPVDTPTVRDFKSEVIPVVANGEDERKLLPTYMPERCEFIVEDADLCLAWGIVRVITDELPVKCLSAQLSGVNPNAGRSDEYIIQEALLAALRMIPLQQDTSNDARFELECTNQTMRPMPVKTSAIRPVAGGKHDKRRPFNSNITICWLNPQCTYHLRDIRVETSRGNIRGWGMCAVAVQAISEPLDIEPYNMYEDNADATNKSEKVKRSRVAQPRVHHVRFKTNGTEPPISIVKRACDDMIERLQMVTTLAAEAEINGDRLDLVIPGETDTIGDLLRRFAYRYAEVKYVGARIDDLREQLVFTLRVDDPESVLAGAIRNAVRSLENLREQFSYVARG
jgi:DNA-directed RNA polymerase subunit L